MKLSLMGYVGAREFSDETGLFKKNRKIFNTPEVSFNTQPSLLHWIYAWEITENQKMGFGRPKNPEFRINPEKSQPWLYV